MCSLAARCVLLLFATGDISQEEQVLRAFDLETRFGPCAGMTRLERWVLSRVLSCHSRPALSRREVLAHLCSMACAAATGQPSMQSMVTLLLAVVCVHACMCVCACRWNRAEKFGLTPPQQVKELLARLKGEQWDKSIWDKTIYDDTV